MTSFNFNKLKLPFKSIKKGNFPSTHFFKTDGIFTDEELKS